MSAIKRAMEEREDNARNHLRVTCELIVGLREALEENKPGLVFSEADGARWRTIYNALDDLEQATCDFYEPMLSWADGDEDSGDEDPEGGVAESPVTASEPLSRQERLDALYEVLKQAQPAYDAAFRALQEREAAFRATLPPEVGNGQGWWSEWCKVRGSDPVFKAWLEASEAYGKLQDPILDLEAEERSEGSCPTCGCSENGECSF